MPVASYTPWSSSGGQRTYYPTGYLEKGVTDAQQALIAAQTPGLEGLEKYEGTSVDEAIKAFISEPNTGAGASMPHLASILMPVDEEFDTPEEPPVDPIDDRVPKAIEEYIGPEVGTILGGAKEWVQAAGEVARFSNTPSYGLAESGFDWFADVLRSGTTLQDRRERGVRSFGNQYEGSLLQTTENNLAKGLGFKYRR